MPTPAEELLVSVEATVVMVDPSEEAVLELESVEASVVDMGPTEEDVFELDSV